jgi:hypothetical protein
MRPRIPSPATVIACIALFAALGGAGYAASKLLPKNSVGTKQLKKNAVTSAKVKNGSLLAKDFKAGQLPAGPQGPKGDTGPQGPKGDTGPATGSAGGDLTGSYPNPTIANGAVTPAKQGAIPHVELFTTNAQTFATGSAEPVVWENELEDEFGMHNGIDNTIVTAPIDGVYAISASVAWATQPAGIRIVELLAGSPLNRRISSAQADPVQNSQTIMNVAGTTRLAAGNTVSVSAYQNSLNPVDVLSLGNSTRLQMTWVGP